MCPACWPPPTRALRLYQLTQIETISNREFARSRDIKIDCDCESNEGGFELKCTSWPQPPQQWRCNSVTQSCQHMSPNELAAATPHDIAHAGFAHTYTHTQTLLLECVVVYSYGNDGLGRRAGKITGEIIGFISSFTRQADNKNTLWTHSFIVVLPLSIYGDNFLRSAHHTSQWWWWLAGGHLAWLWPRIAPDRQRYCPVAWGGCVQQQQQQVHNK